ncbi:hypothetical protein FNF27_04051 [Cafeteria roenbergensis]|uniref:Malonyl-CoA decarboxylase C-terminal domain-containing protein n=2 Tax=Cafeteria roenbergensis TaxID=33653 RepID=A0A5A8E1Q7_CAFRO|nr:hypothetical protein FNF31_07645 [Cafeteria roenbergensis]KAA0153137.1 hypothetical protein FNF29_03325 [Cafeteria roenbergensis]KAA0170757.1 hypothetical protein FNF28_01299 [Cafeteria roenbergensis]KAA0174453.1 hypothetical protein FNF27_04051 [Cafeteria roenbergensis]|eukprot:KAA0153137.1 hypothetical protein FNF29_03325 [Cafeteria roenbergensis]
MTSLLRRAASAYLLFEKRPTPGSKAAPKAEFGSPTFAEEGARKALDPVLNFHIQNGAVVARVCPAASNTSRVCRASLGVMVNYQYPGPSRHQAARVASSRYLQAGAVPFRGGMLPDVFTGTASLPLEVRASWTKLIFVAMALRDGEAVGLSSSEESVRFVQPGSLLCVCKGELETFPGGHALRSGEVLQLAEEQRATSRGVAWVVLIAADDVKRAIASAGAEGRPNKL